MLYHEIPEDIHYFQTHKDIFKSEINDSMILWSQRKKVAL